MKISQRHLEDILLAMLSVNNYPVTDAWALLPALRTAGLFDAARVASMDQSEIVARLKMAGYDRGKITEILAPRLQALMRAAEDGVLDGVSMIVEAEDRKGLRGLLLPIPGVGPRVLETAWMLLSARPDS